MLGKEEGGGGKCMCYPIDGGGGGEKNEMGSIQIQREGSSSSEVCTYRSGTKGEKVHF